VNRLALLVQAVSWAALLDAETGLNAAEDFYRVAQRGGKWYVIDPQGNPFHMRGCNHYSNGTHMPWNLKQRFDNDRTKRSTSTRSRTPPRQTTFRCAGIV
jgi:hypothetical protein